MKPSPTPAEIDRISANRILSDADLIRAGAVYEGGVLKPTAEQIEAAAKEGPTTSRLGMLALHSDADQELSRGQEVFTAAALNRLNLAHRLEQALEPYAAIFADKLPAPDSNERSILRKIKAKERRLPTWTAKRDLDGVEVNYRFKLRYLPGEDYNQLTSAKIELRDELNEDRLEV
ncbi:MAG TPA: hypothetical protein VFK03_00900, partial [Candidatus Saccharimonadales bacterium]|nr:hypothetical protein [Candidatus Saccharimonadales bacterium]